MHDKLTCRPRPPVPTLIPHTTQHMARDHVLRGGPMGLLRFGRPRHGRPGRGGAQISKQCSDARRTSPGQLRPYVAARCIWHGVAQLRPSPAAWTDSQGSATQADALLDSSPRRGTPSIGPVASGRSLRTYCAPHHHHLGLAQEPGSSAPASGNATLATTRGADQSVRAPSATDDLPAELRRVCRNP